MLNPFFRWLEGLTDPFPPQKPEKPPTGLLRFILHYSRPFYPMLAASVAFSTAIAFLEVYLFAYLGQLVDLLAAETPATLWQNHGTMLMGMAVVALIIMPAMSLVVEAIEHNGLRGNFSMRIRWLAHRYVLRQSLDFFQNDFAGRIATKVMQTALGVRDAVMKIGEVFVYITVYFLSALGLFAAIDWRLAIPLSLWLLGYIGAMRFFVPRLGKISEEQADMRSLVTGRIVDSYTNISTVKLFAHADREDGYAREGMGMMLDTVYRSMRLTTWLTVILALLTGMLITMSAAVSIWLWQTGAATPGAVAFSVGLAMRLKGLSHWIIWEVAGLFEDIGVVHDGIETIARERSITDAAEARPLRVTHGEIRFEGLHFNYGKDTAAKGHAAVDGVNLAIRPGEKVGLVGRSGAGKSTLVSLLLRFYDVEAGRIVIDGQDISGVTQESLRASIGLVTQDTSLLHRTIRDNILYGKPEAPMAELIGAAERAHAHDFIAALEDQKGRKAYDAHVGERGVKLSGGQRQRIAIARVLLKNAPILILDEATSALDSEVEAAIQESLYNLMEGKTVIAVAHRLSTIAAMDRLIIMDRGRIVEEGSHQHLLRQGGIYASLWQRQSGGFLAHEVEADAQAAE